MRMRGMKILELTVSDIEQLLPLIESYWRHDTIVGYEPSRLRRQLTEFLSEAAYGCGWLATRGDSAVGRCEHRPGVRHAFLQICGCVVWHFGQPAGSIRLAAGPRAQAAR